MSVLDGLIDGLAKLGKRVKRLETLEGGGGSGSLTAGVLFAYDRAAHTATVTVGGVNYVGIPVSYAILPLLEQAGVNVGATAGVLGFDPITPANGCVVAVYSATPPPDPLDAITGHAHTGVTDDGPIIDAGTVDGIHASATSAASKLLALDASQQFKPAGDVFPRGDAAGSRQRHHGLGFPAAPTYPFDGESLAAFTWAGAPFLTPAVASQSLSQLIVGDATDNWRAFYYMGTGLNTSPRRMIATLIYLSEGAFVGARWDDGSDNNYLEMCLRRTAGALTNEVITNSRSGGGAVTTTVHQTGFMPGQFVTLTPYLNGTLYSGWYIWPTFGIGGEAQGGAYTATMTWTPTRRGIVYSDPGAYNDTWQTARIDAYT